MGRGSLRTPRPPLPRSEAAIASVEDPAGWIVRPRSLDPRAERSAFGHRAVRPEDHDVLRSAAELRDRERACGGILLVTFGLVVMTADPDDPMPPDAQDTDLTGLYRWF